MLIREGAADLGLTAQRHANLSRACTEATATWCSCRFWPKPSGRSPPGEETPSPALANAPPRRWPPSATPGVAHQPRHAELPVRITPPPGRPATRYGGGGLGWPVPALQAGHHDLRLPAANASTAAATFSRHAPPPAPPGNSTTPQGIPGLTSPNRGRFFPRRRQDYLTTRPQTVSCNRCLPRPGYLATRPEPGTAAGDQAPNAGLGRPPVSQVQVSSAPKVQVGTSRRELIKTGKRRATERHCRGGARSSPRHLRPIRQAAPA